MIPKITTTEEALAFGKTASPDQISELKLRRRYYKFVCKKRPENASMEELNIYIGIAFKGQLMREALESANESTI